MYLSGLKYTRPINGLHKLDLRGLGPVVLLAGKHRLVVEQLRPHGTDVPARRQGGPYHIGGELPEQKAQT